MDKTFKKVLKTKTASAEELGDLLKYINLPENRHKYYLSSTSKEDRIGKYRSLIVNPDDKENSESHKIYLKDNDKDLIVYRLRYYDILREDCSNTKKAMQLWTLQKNIEYVFSKELKIHQKTGEFEDLQKLLEKVKKARSYYSLKMFLNDNSSGKRKTKINK